MSESQEDIFDQQIKAALEDAEEEVPEHIWAAISDQLDAIDARKSRRAVVVPWIRRVGIGLAAAAAVVLGVFLFVSPKNENISDEAIAVVTEPEGAGVEAEVGVIEDVGADVVEAKAGVVEDVEVDVVEGRAGVVESVESEEVESEEVDGVESEGEVEETIYDQISGIEKSVAQNIENEKVVSKVEEVESSEEAEKVEEVESQEEVEKEDWSDPFAFDDEEEVRQSKVAITMSGNSIGSTTSSSSISSSSRQFVSSVIKENTGITETSESNFNIPLSFGLGVKIIFTPHWSLGVGVNYSLLSRSFSGTYTTYSSDTDSYTSTNYNKIRNTQSYIGIPINVYYSVISSKIVDFYVYAGGTGEKCICNKYVMDDITYKKDVKGLQFSVDAGIGVEFMIVDMVGLYIDPSIRYYFENSKQPTSIRTQEKLNFGFELGFRIRL